MENYDWIRETQKLAQTSCRIARANLSVSHIKPEEAEVQRSTFKLSGGRGTKCQYNENNSALLTTRLPHFPPISVADTSISIKGGWWSKDHKSWTHEVAQCLQGNQWLGGVKCISTISVANEHRHAKSNFEFYLGLLSEYVKIAELLKEK